jgi:hypothetical protein
MGANLLTLSPSLPVVNTLPLIGLLFECRHILYKKTA